MNGPKPWLWKTYTGAKPDQWGWKTKKDASTFFPDNWSKDKIKNEIAEAYSVKIYERDSNTWGKVYRWTSESWQKYEIVEDIDETIESTYWIFD